ncbi:MAG: FAD-binding oxidoreductase [Chloroflexi bacterium]|nr:FAD-binding oxidoreductase [Chloroflexota bacterium]
MTNQPTESVRHAMPANTERGPEAYAIDGLTPRLAFAPDSRSEAAMLLRAANAAGLVVAPQGGRTATGFGRPLTEYDVALDLRGIHRVVEYVPDDLTVTVEAGITLAEVQRVLGEHGQYLPMDAPPDDHVTIGGLLATAKTGAWRGHLGSPRDHLLGVEVALPSGELARSGGRVVKNVTGYDLHRLHTGALGAFGVIVEAAFKVSPRPAQTMTLAAPAADQHEAMRVARATWDASLATRALTLLGGGAAAHLGLPARPTVIVEFAGQAAAVERSAREFEGLAGRTETPTADLWRKLRATHGDTATTVARLGVPPSLVADVVASAEGAGGRAWGHLAAGAVIVHGDIGVDALRRLRAMAEERQGFLQLEHAPVDLRREFAPAEPGDGDLVRALRDRFDLKRTINRGRWGSGL